MKIYIALLLTTFWSLTATALRCWTCENASSQKDCIKSGSSKQCRYLEKVCQTEVRYSVGWGERPLIRTGCKEPHACSNNNIQNPRGAWLPSQCNEKKFNSVCRCCCSGNHCNRKNLMCRPKIKEPLRSTAPPKDLPAVSTSAAPSEPTCVRFPKKPTNGRVVCEHGKVVGSSCVFLCNIGYQLIGRTSTTCVQGRKLRFWRGRTPTCRKPPHCGKIPEAPKDGMKECDGGGEVGTRCDFVCDDGFEMEGPDAISCVPHGDTASWNHKAPSCLSPLPPCPGLGELRHGNVTCTNNDHSIGTKCSFQCSDVGYELLPIDREHTECVREGGIAKWSRRKPCCNAMCPPIAKKDIVIVIDSSKSINQREWRKLKKFVTDVIEKFQVSQDTVQFAVYRFNGKVDEKSQILFGEYADVDDLVTKVQNLPKEGGGTKVGNALRHARDFVLKERNRIDVDDIVWVLTDGKSKDEFEGVAKDLRDSGVEIIALGISRKGEEEFMEQLTAMTGDKDLVVKVTDVLSSFSGELVRLLSQKICEVSCE